MSPVDVLVVGAGPAGATAALNLAPTRSVVMIDTGHATGPRIGESLSAAARRLLTDMGLFASFENEGHAPWYGNQAVWGGPVPVETDVLRDPDGHGWHLDRTRFEMWLRSVATERGATFLSPARLDSIESIDGGWNAQLTTPEGRLTLSSGFVIDAGGRAAPLARRLGAQRRVQDRLVCGWIHGSVTGRGKGAGLTYVEAVKDGWWYTSPLPSLRRVLAFHTDADLPAARLARNRDALLEHAMTAPELASVLAASGFKPEERFGLTVAHSAVLDPCADRAWLAAGDAALSFDPLSSQGLLNALFTGLAAAEAADGYLSARPSALSEYARLIQGIRDAYRCHLDYWYSRETRWPDEPFWQRRQC